MTKKELTKEKGREKAKRKEKRRIWTYKRRTTRNENKGKKPTKTDIINNNNNLEVKIINY
jgi:hypothetical protein